MSFASKNLFSLLSDDGEFVTAPAPAKEVAAPAPVAKKTQNKKTAGPNGNDAAFKNKNVGRAANKAKDAAPLSGDKPRRRGPPSKNPRPDRHSQTGKTDTIKKVHQGWGDDSKKLDDEVAGEEIAKSDEQNDESTEAAAATEATEPEVPTKTIDQYFAELSTKSSEINARTAEERKIEAAADAAIVKKEQEDFFGALKVKSQKSRSRKEKVILDIEQNFVQPPREQREFRESRAPARKNAAKGPKAAKPVIKAITEKEFPALGA